MAFCVGSVRTRYRCWDRSICWEYAGACVFIGVVVLLHSLSQTLFTYDLFYIAYWMLGSHATCLYYVGVYHCNFDWVLVWQSYLDVDACADVFSIKTWSAQVNDLHFGYEPKALESQSWSPVSWFINREWPSSYVLWGPGIGAETGQFVGNILVRVFSLG